MCGRYAVKKSTLIIANSLVKKNINVDGGKKRKSIKKINKKKLRKTKRKYNK